MLTKLERIKRDIEELSKFNSTPGEGLTRFSLTEADRGAREYLKKEMREIGLEVYEDSAASIFGRMDGTEKDAPSIIIGSHFDSVKHGGNFDGPAGVVMGLEVMRVLKEQGIKTKYPIECIAMIEEEGGRFGSGLFGSRAIAGTVPYQELLNSVDENGISMAEAFESFGFNPQEIKKAQRDPEKIKAFIELHIEQGPILEKEKKEIGLVEFIVGIYEFKVTVKGRPDHAGTTPMDMRKDALCLSAEVISKIKDFAIKAGKGTVATVGLIDVKPGATNIVPGEVQFTVDIRSKENDCMKMVRNNIENMLTKIEEEYRIEWDIDELLMVEPVKLSNKLLKLFKEVAEDKSFSYKKMISGAAHDAMIMASITDVALVFVPCKDGRSHCPEEWTDYEDLQKGIELIYHAILRLGVEE
jgi:allantoate deiminase